MRSSTFQFDETAIIIPGEGGIGDIYHYVEGKYALHQRAYRVHIISNRVNSKFLYHYMNESFKQYIQAKSVGATAISIRKPMLEKFPIPIPPLEAQHEIVRVLDNFTELTAELTARKKQYEYYRNLLLNFDPENGENTNPFATEQVVWKTLGEVLNHLRTGLNPRSNFKGSRLAE